MPYVLRDASGNICGLFANAQPGSAEEWVNDEAQEVKDFRAAAEAVTEAE